MRIAILEDDSIQAEFLSVQLTEAGHHCTIYYEGKPLLLALAQEHPYNLLLVDWEIPDVSGLDVIHWVRTQLGYRLPILMVTARIEEEDIVTGLQAGADDYVCKPVTPAILRARVQALGRRVHPSRALDDSFSFGAYHVNPSDNTIALHGEVVELAPKELELATLLFRNPGRLFSRDVLSTTVWNREIPATSRTLDTHLSNVRRKLQLRPENGVRLTASYALGYRLDVIDQTASE